jgi:hypothetical protein
MPVAVGQSLIRWGLYWDFLQLALDNPDQTVQVGGGEVGEAAYLYITAPQGIVRFCYQGVP